MKFTNKLSSVDAAELVVYANKTAFERNEALKSSHTLAGLGISEENALFVIVPNSVGTLYFINSY
jgi:hypothetical protein